MENNIVAKKCQPFNFKAVRFPEPVSIPREAIEAFVRVFQNIADFHKEEEENKQQDVSSHSYHEQLDKKFSGYFDSITETDQEHFQLDEKSARDITNLMMLVQNPKGRNIDDWEVYLENLLNRNSVIEKSNSESESESATSNPVEIEWFRSFKEAFEAAKEGHLISNDDLWKEYKFLYWVPGSKFKVTRIPLLNVFSLNTPCTYEPHLDMAALTVVETENGPVLGLECKSAPMSANCPSNFHKAWFRITPEIINLEVHDSVKISLK